MHTSTASALARFARAAACAALLVNLPALAQTPPAVAGPAVAPTAALAGRTLDGRPFTLAALRGKVVLVYFWRTDCAVCRTIMAELLANVGGWQGKPFELVAVSLDARRADLVDYERIIATTVPTAQRFSVLWAGEPGHADSLLSTRSSLPLNVIIDPQGRVVQRHEGRLPGEAWDRIAELMP